MKILFEIAGAPVTLYGVLTAAAILAFWLLGLLYLRRRQVSGGKAVCWMVCTALLGWLVSRLVFVACNAAYYIDELDGSWAPALCFWDGGYSMIGAMLGAALGAALAVALTGERSAHMLNAVGLGLPLGIAVLRLAEFFCDTAESGDIGEGRYLEDIDWLDSLLERMGLLMQADGDFVYPACLAEAAAVLLLCIGLIIWLARCRWSVPGADALTVCLVLYGAIQMVLEQIRDDGHLVFHFVHLEQVLALVLLLAGLIIWTKRFLQAETKRPTLAVVWIVSLVCIGLAVWACFGVDRWDNKLLAWLLLIVPTGVLACAALYLRSAANYLTGEE